MKVLAFLVAGFAACRGQRARPVLAGFNWAQIKPPLLFVHPENDGCGATPYREATRVTRCPLVAIAAWMLGKPFLRTIQ